MQVNLATAAGALLQPATMSRIATIEEAIEDIRKGRMVILVDDEDRENEGDLVIAADKVTPQAINFMATHARGLVCVAMPGDKIDALGLPPMTSDNRAPLGTAFTVSVDAAAVDSGISAKGRAATVRTLMHDGCTAEDLRTPGSTFPLRARRGGVLVRAGQTEGGVDLSRLAGLRPGAVICEIMNPDGTMMRLAKLLEYGATHGLKVVTVADLIGYRMQKESLVKAVAEVNLPTDHGLFRAVAFQNELDTCLHLALVMGDVHPDVPTLVRVHRADLIGDVFGFTGDRGTSRLEWALRRIAQEGHGVLLYLRTGANGEMALDSLQSYLARTDQPLRGKPRRQGPMGFREFGLGAQMLSHLGLNKIRVITGNPRPFAGLSGFGLEIVEYLPLTGELRPNVRAVTPPGDGELDDGQVANG